MKKEDVLGAAAAAAGEDGRKRIFFSCYTEYGARVQEGG